MQTDEHPNSKLVSTPALGLNCAQCKVNPPKARYGNSFVARGDGASCLRCVVFERAYVHAHVEGILAPIHTASVAVPTRWIWCASFSYSRNSILQMPHHTNTPHNPIISSFQYPSPVASETPNPLGGDRNLDRPDLTTLGARERGTDDPVASESRVSKEHPVVREDIPELADDDEGYEVDEFEEEVIDEGFVWFKRLAQPEGNEGV
ncbi:hypothetical protein BC938DRAFT_484251 [Jimgerdemannia flammicorona]|uniref:Uncharacterized protein n=1 Tax=Jimgerdemannia flammicorona TaxID=994334 RepID=A0A433QV93_9FUNG|nr:hypothetical protein BC938DRAFT_484251 [Jimgerdemannia flammicorona]